MVKVVDAGNLGALTSSLAQGKAMTCELSLQTRNSLARPKPKETMMSGKVPMEAAP